MQMQGSKNEDIMYEKIMGEGRGLASTLHPDQMQHMPHCNNLRFVGLLPSLRYSAQPVEEDSPSDVEYDIYPQETEVSPALSEVDVYSRKELIRIRHLAEATLLSTHCLRVINISSGHFAIGIEVIATSLVFWCKESLELVARAVSRSLAQCRTHQAADEIRERVDSVHEDPESWQF